MQKSKIKKIQRRNNTWVNTETDENETKMNWKRINENVVCSTRKKSHESL